MILASCVNCRQNETHDFFILLKTWFNYRFKNNKWIVRNWDILGGFFQKLINGGICLGLESNVRFFLILS